MPLKKDSKLQQINNFFMMNWWMTGISNIIIIILIINTNMNIDESMKSLKTAMDKTMSNIVFGTPDGRVALIDRQPVNSDSDLFVNYLGMLAKTMETSESKLTHGFDKKVHIAV